MNAQDPRAATATEIEAWMIAHVSNTLKISPDVVDAERTFEEFGMGSLESVGLIAALEEWLARPLDATLAWDYPTIRALAAHLANAELARPGV